MHAPYWGLSHEQRTIVASFLYPAGDTAAEQFSCGADAGRRSSVSQRILVTTAVTDVAQLSGVHTRPTDRTRRAQPRSQAVQERHDSILVLPAS